MLESGCFLLKFRPMTNRNTRSGKLAFLLIAVVVLAGFQPGPAKAQDNEELCNRLPLARAVQGNAELQFALGVLLRSGELECLPQDDKEAVKWYRMAAEQGHAEAQNNLANLCLLAYLGHLAGGEGSKCDPSEAYAWWVLSAAQGNEAAAKMKDRFKYGVLAQYVIQGQRLAARMLERIKSSKSQ